MRTGALAVLFGFVAIAFANNADVFAHNAYRIVPLVVAHNTVALMLGALAAAAARLPRNDRRAVTLEVGIQNSGLGLIILFTFSPMPAA